MEFIDLKRQYQRHRHTIDQAVKRVIESGRFILGEEVEMLEAELCRFTGAPFAVGVASGTEALLLGLMAKDVSRGDVVLTTPFSFFATVETIMFLGAEPAFSDIDPETFNLDPRLLDEAISAIERNGKRVAAVLPVDLYGLCADMDAIGEVAQRHGVFLLEDACQSFGASLKDKKSCNLCLLGATSFFPSKPLGCYGDGGMIFTSDETLFERLRMLRVHGSRRRYVHEEIGLNSRLDALQAAILRAKLQFFQEELDLRQKVAGRYFSMLAPLVSEGHIEFQKIPKGYKSVFAQFTIRIKTMNRDRVAGLLNEQGVPTAIHYPMPLHFQEALKEYGFQKGMFPNAELAACQVLSLPMHPYLDEEEQTVVAKALFNAFGMDFKQ